MGTMWTLKIHAPDEAAAKAAATAAFTRISGLNAEMSDYLPESGLSRLSATAGSGEAITVRGDLLSVLRQATAAAEESSGAFDITVGPCVQLWRAAKKTRRLPAPDTLAAARAACGWRGMAWSQEDTAVTLTKKDMRLDLGGIAKGWAQDAAMQVLKDHHISSALIDAGGGVLVSGPPPGRESWGVALARFAGEEKDSVLAVKDGAVATSGDLQQSVRINGVRYSHIIDPTTGLGMTKPVQVTVVAPGGALADWLATAVCVMGPERGIPWLEKTHPEAQARAGQLSEDGSLTVRETPGFAKLLSK